MTLYDILVKAHYQGYLARDHAQKHMAKVAPDGYVLAVDFDGTLCSETYPGIGEPNLKIIYSVKQAEQLGAHVVLWTCREDELLDQAVKWCHGYGLKFAAVNDNAPCRIERYGGNCRKVSCDELWDDRAVRI